MYICDEIKTKPGALPEKCNLGPSAGIEPLTYLTASDSVSVNHATSTKFQ